MQIKYYPICEIILQIVLPILTALHLCDYLSAAAALRIMNGTSRWFLVSKDVASGKYFSLFTVSRNIEHYCIFYVHNDGHWIECETIGQIQ